MNGRPSTLVFFLNGRIDLFDQVSASLQLFDIKSPPEEGPLFAVVRGAVRADECIIPLNLLSREGDLSAARDAVKPELLNNPHDGVIVPCFARRSDIRQSRRGASNRGDRDGRDRPEQDRRRADADW